MQTYQAILIHPEISGGRCSGNLCLNLDGIFFQSEELNYSIRYVNLEINAGGAGNRFVFFKDKKQEAISLYTSDTSVLKNTFITSNSNFSKDISQAKKTLNKIFIATSIVIGLIIIFVGCLYLLKDKMVEGLASQVPIEWEQQAGDKLFSALSLQYDFIKDDSLKNNFLKIAAPLFNQIEKQGYKIDLYFVKDPTINAFALPGGKVVVQSGLIENAKSWEEIMGVLSHELAHVTKRHHVRGVIDNIGIFAILSATLGDVSGLAATFANLGGDLASLSNSRSFENEADEAGWNYLINAKMNPNGLISFFETLKKENESELESTVNASIDLSFLSTHPDTQNRIDHLKEKEKSLNQKFIPLPNDFEDFKSSILKIN